MTKLEKFSASKVLKKMLKEPSYSAVDEMEYEIERECLLSVWEMRIIARALKEAQAGKGEEVAEWLDSLRRYFWEEIAVSLNEFEQTGELYQRPAENSLKEENGNSQALSTHSQALSTHSLKAENSQEVPKVENYYWDNYGDALNYIREKKSEWTDWKLKGKVLDKFKVSAPTYYRLKKMV